MQGKDYSVLSEIKAEADKTALDAQSKISLKYFSLSYNEISDNHIFDNFKFWLSKSDIEELDLSYNNLGD